MRIFITGHQHSGTSILKKIIGNSPDVYDMLNEVFPDWLLGEEIEGENEKDFVVLKYPDCTDEVVEFSNELSAIKFICIIRDPRDIFTSLKERHGNSYTFDAFKKTWIPIMRNCIEVSKLHNGYIVRYEDLFKNDYEEVEKIFNWLGVPYEDTVVTKNEERKVTSNCEEFPETIPTRKNHDQFRSYQISSPFTQMSGRYLTHLSGDELKYFEDGDVSELMTEFGYLE
jgi:hypothetical protein